PCGEEARAASELVPPDDEAGRLASGLSLLRRDCRAAGAAACEEPGEELAAEGDPLHRGAAGEHAGGGSGDPGLLVATGELEEPGGVQEEGSEEAALSLVEVGSRLPLHDGGNRLLPLEG